MKTEQFETLITDALQTIPERIRVRMENVAFVVEEEARAPGRGEEEVWDPNASVLLGLYQGVPLMERGPQYQYALPDKITIFQKTIERIAGGDAEHTAEIVHQTVLHEVAHHLGFSESEVRRWERRQKRR